MIPLGIMASQSSTPLPPFDILTSIPWHAAYWAEDPGWSNPGDGNTVTTWDDATTNGRDLTQGTAGSRPTYRSSSATLNNKPALEFVSDFFTATSAAWGTLTQPVSIVVVGFWTAPDASNDAIVGANSGTFLLRKSATSSIQIFAAGGVTGVTVNGNGHLYGGVYNGASSNIIYDGTLTSGNVGAGSLAGVTLSGATGAAASSHTFTMAFAGFYSGIITSHLRWTDLKTWVTSQYGISM